MKVKSESEVTQLCPTLSDPMDCSPPGSSIHGIFQARVLEWGAIAFSSRFPKIILILLRFPLSQTVFQVPSFSLSLNLRQVLSHCSSHFPDEDIKTEGLKHR